MWFFFEFNPIFLIIAFLLLLVGGVAFLIDSIPTILAFIAIGLLLIMLFKVLYSLWDIVGLGIGFGLLLVFLAGSLLWLNRTAPSSDISLRNFSKAEVFMYTAPEDIEINQSSIHKGDPIVITSRFKTTDQSIVYLVNSNNVLVEKKSSSYYEHYYSLQDKTPIDYFSFLISYNKWKKSNTRISFEEALKDINKENNALKGKSLDQRFTHVLLGQTYSTDEYRITILDDSLLRIVSAAGSHEKEYKLKRDIKGIPTLYVDNKCFEYHIKPNGNIELEFIYDNG